MRAFGANMGLIWADVIGDLSCGRAGEGQSENLRFGGWILEVGLQVGLQKWGYIFRKVGLQNRVLEGWDREGVKYCFFSDSPEKRADRYPRNTILF